MVRIQHKLLSSSVFPRLSSSHYRGIFHVWFRNNTVLPALRGTYLNGNPPRLPLYHHPEHMPGHMHGTESLSSDTLVPMQNRGAIGNPNAHHVESNTSVVRRLELLERLLQDHYLDAEYLHYSEQSREMRMPSASEQPLLKSDGYHV